MMPELEERLPDDVQDYLDGLVLEAETLNAGCLLFFKRNLNRLRELGYDTGIYDHLHLYYSDRKKYNDDKRAELYGHTGHA